MVFSTVLLRNSLGRVVSSTSSSRTSALLSLRWLRPNPRWFSVIHLSDQTALEKFCQLNKRTVLYFTAEWCGPCGTIKPMVHELSKQYENVAFGLIDIDFNEESSGKLQIRSVPTFIFQFNGEEIDRFAGADKERLLKNVVELSHKN